jgi:uncharacterized protein YigA (DUF484 family)
LVNPASDAFFRTTERMSNRAELRDSAAAAAQAVKTYVRMNRAELAHDGELLSLLLPERFDSGEVRDLQRFVIDRLREENGRLKAERDALTSARESVVRLGDGVKRAVLDLLDARSFEEAIEVATTAAASFGAERAALCVEAVSGLESEGVRIIAPGTTLAVLGHEGTGAILSGGGEMLLGAGGRECKSVAVFRLRIGRDTPAAMYVLGAREAGCFEGAETAADLGFFARALERTIRAWLDLPKT